MVAVHQPLLITCCRLAVHLCPTEMRQEPTFPSIFWKLSVFILMIESPLEVGFHVFFLLSEFGTSWTNFLNGIVLPLPNCKTLPSCKKALVWGGSARTQGDLRVLLFGEMERFLDWISIAVLSSYLLEKMRPNGENKGHLLCCPRPPVITTPLTKKAFLRILQSLHL